MNLQTFNSLAQAISFIGQPNHDMPKRKIGYETIAVHHGKSNNFSEVGIYHHGNLIMVQRAESFEISLAGWNSKTTKDRLNQLLKARNYRLGIRTIKGRPYLTIFTDREHLLLLNINASYFIWLEDNYIKVAVNGNDIDSGHGNYNFWLGDN